MKNCVVLLLMMLCIKVNAHPAQHHGLIGKAQYLANEGVMVQSGEQQILFDPFFHKNFGIYQSVPDDLLQAIMNGDSPYDRVSAVFISHAHGDHFAPDRVLNYLKRHKGVNLFAPMQAVKQLSRQNGYEEIAEQVNSITLDFGDEAKVLSTGGLSVDAVRIPHAGWPGRADVENIVFRVTLDSGLTVMHLGDADVNVYHYMPYREHWQTKHSHMGFPPYWFLQSMQGRDILKDYLYVHEPVGVHVPVDVPGFLDAKGYLYFSRPGQWHPVHQHQEPADSQ